MLPGETDFVGPTLQGRKVTVYRVEGSPVENHRINVAYDGTVSLVPDSNKVIWLNFGDEARADSYFLRKLDAGLPDVQRKSFDADAEFLVRVRQDAVPEKYARQNPDRPIISRDPYPDQYGIPKSYFDDLLN
ncbi:hypothetical protein [Chromobacterium sphagni]|uniref:hypothetical protein n=1 Tax=Chromobacterium sphagni TaxID=1903179 RepID=UPI00111432B1|nr:hypothetical protein [Chromobacterium sphagni]